MTDYSVHDPVTGSRVASWDMETEVAVVGFGAAGACAALEAAHNGAGVTLFEVAGGSGGASALSGGEIYFGGNGGTPAQRDAGFNDTTEAMETYLNLVGGPDADREKTALYARESLAHHQWLKDQGVPYKGTYIAEKIIEPETDDTLIWSGSEEAWPFSEQTTPAPRGHVIQFEGWGGGRKLVDILEARVREAGVDIHTSARAISLVMDQGQVTGLVVKIDNQPRLVKAGAVILATGGFCMNDQMMHRYAPEACKLSNPIGAQDDGSGIMLGMSAGADAIHMDEFFTTCPWIIPPSLVRGIFVNSRGQRFINEDAYHGRVSRIMLDQPGDRAWLLVDNAIFGYPVELAGIEIAAVGETWEEVESELGLPANTLSHSVQFFNHHAAHGEDPLYHKAAKWMKVLDEGPFAALELNFATSFFSFFTLGGLSTRTGGEVQDRAGRPIPGLYAAGRATSGLPRWGHGYSSGLSLADCTFFGRQAGHAAALFSAARK